MSPIDLTLYVATTSGGKSEIQAFAKTGSTYSTTPTKTIGPFSDVQRDGADVRQRRQPVRGTLVDSGRRCAPYPNSVRVYDVSTSTPTVERVIPDVVPGNPSDITGLAIAESPGAQPSAPPSGQVGPITFDSYSNGPVRGQNGWQSNSCGGYDYDANVVEVSSYPSSTWPGTPPTKALQVDNAVTQGCYSGLGTPDTPLGAGIPSAITDVASSILQSAHCGPVCQPFFSTQFVVTSATGGFQPALEMSISPVWDNDGARMQYIGLWHTLDSNGNNKLLVFTNDVDDVIGAQPPCFQCADFVPWEIGYVDPTQPHTIGMTMSFVSPDSDVVKFYVDGSLAGIQQQQFRSWEDYYLYDTESDPPAAAPYSRGVNDLLFHPGNVDTCKNFQDYENSCNQRSGGPDHTSNAGNGFLFTNITECAGTASSCASAITTSGSARSVQSIARTPRAVHVRPRLMSVTAVTAAAPDHVTRERPRRTPSGGASAFSGRALRERDVRAPRRDAATTREYASRPRDQRADRRDRERRRHDRRRRGRQRERHDDARGGFAQRARRPRPRVMMRIEPRGTRDLPERVPPRARGGSSPAKSLAN